MNRKTIVVLMAVALVLLLAGGVVLAKDFQCDPPTGDKCVGTKKADDILGTTGDDEIYGRGNDVIGGHFPFFSDSGDDTIFGRRGDDEIRDFNAGGDVDRTFGGKGDDVINVGDGDAFDEVDCGPGKDQFAADPGDTIAANCETRS